MADHACPICGGETWNSSPGKSKRKMRRFCKSCKKAFTPDSAGKGRPPIGDRPMTGAERAAKYRLRKKIAERSIDNNKSGE